MNKLPQHNMRYGGTYAYLAEAMGATRDISRAAFSVIPGSHRPVRAGRGSAGIIAEFLRIKGELFRLKNGPSAVEAAEESFQQSLDWGATAGRTFVGAASGDEPRGVCV